MSESAITLAAEAVLATAILTVAYSYVIYPAILWSAACIFGRSPVPPTAKPSPRPRVSLLIAAHNEEDVIAEKLENALATDDPGGQLEIVIASDGSTDRTAEIVRTFAPRGVRLLDNRERRGKSAVLNATLPTLTGDIVVLSDANTLFDEAAIGRLVRWFADPHVGVVCGRLVLIDPDTGHNVDSLYWRYETFLKINEARLGALLGANGAIYAIRRSLYVPMPDNTIVDDFVIPLLARLRHGIRIVYDAEAIAFEETPAQIRSEFRRRARIGTGGYQSLVLLWPLLDPRHGWTAFAFFSHKVLRWITPFLLVAAFTANLLLLDLPFYQATMAAQVAFYLLSFAGMQIHGNQQPLRLLRLASMFTSMNAALMVGFWRWLLMPQQGTWQRTAR
jgi:cellulose synthase/poly-beta-1,6-N-acetylglucosamine synthase-like glycosyltransferase